jgi:hypothetical protein
MKEGLKFVGFLNFIISIIGSIILFANSKIEYESYLGYSRSKVDPTIIANGLAILVTGLTIIVICFGIAKVIENQEREVDNGDNKDNSDDTKKVEPHFPPTIG